MGYKKSPAKEKNKAKIIPVIRKRKLSN